ncbi:MAG: hypothetical protein RSF79_05415 [Janthinobacterium sp.]
MREAPRQAGRVDAQAGNATIHAFAVFQQQGAAHQLARFFFAIVRRAVSLVGAIAIAEGAAFAQRCGIGKVVVVAVEIEQQLEGRLRLGVARVVLAAIARRLRLFQHGIDGAGDGQRVARKGRLVQSVAAQAGQVAAQLGRD